MNAEWTKFTGQSREEALVRMQFQGYRGVLPFTEEEEARQFLRHHFRGQFGMRTDFSMIVHLAHRGVVTRCVLWGRHELLEEAGLKRSAGATMYLLPQPLPTRRTQRARQGGDAHLTTLLPDLPSPPPTILLPSEELGQQHQKQLQLQLACEALSASLSSSSA